MKRYVLRVFLFLTALFVFVAAASAGSVYFVSTSGSDRTGDGSESRPFASIMKAVLAVPDDGSRILVEPGTYKGTCSIARAFKNRLFVESKEPYRARLVNLPGGIVKVLYIAGSNITLSGFEITNEGEIPPDYSSKNEYLVQITGPAADITVNDCILHDNFINDMVKINSGAERILFSGNVCYNQGRDLQYKKPKGFQHMDINTVSYVTVQDCIFFNNYRDNRSKTCNGSFIVCKNSEKTFHTHDNLFQRNIFLNWQGPSDQAMLLFGEDTHAMIYGLVNGTAQNNLFIMNDTGLGGSGAFTVKGCKDIIFRANTVVGNAFNGRTWPFAFRVCTEKGELTVDGVGFFNNVFASADGRMTKFNFGDDAQSENVSYDANCYWNNGKAIPVDPGSNVHFKAVSVDARAVTSDPMLPKPGAPPVLPEWDSAKLKFASGAGTIREEFVRLVNGYGKIPKGSGVAGKAVRNNMPEDDILGKKRKAAPDIGCFELEAN